MEAWFTTPDEEMKRFLTLLLLVTTLLALFNLPTPSVSASGHWERPFQISHVAERPFRSDPGLAPGPDGTARVGWIQPDAETLGFRGATSLYVPGRGWGVPLFLGPAFSNRQPSVAVNDTGHALIGYVGRAFHPQIWSVGLEREDGPGYPEDVVRGGQVWQVGVALNHGMQGAVVWEWLRPNPVYSGIREEVWVGRHDSTRGWLPAFRLGGTDDTSARSPFIAAGPDGSLITVWLQHSRSPTGQDGFVARSFEPTNGWKPAVTIWNGTGRGVEGFDFGSDSSGRAILVWRERPLLGSSEEGEAIWAAHYDPATGWLEPLEVASGLPAVDFHVRLSVTASGHALAAWTENRSGPWVSRFLPDSGWENSVQLQTTEATRGGIALAGNEGNFLVTWREGQAPDRSSLWEARFDPSSGWTRPNLIASIVGFTMFPQQATLDSQGNAVVVWSQVGQEESGVWASHFPRGGSPTLTLVVLSLTVGPLVALALYLYFRRRKSSH